MRCAVIQMSSGQNVDANLQQALSLVQKAAAQKAQLVVLPEMFACLGVSNQVALAKSRFTQQDVIKTLLSWAKQYQCYLVAGSIPMLAEKNQPQDKVLAACLVCSPQGKLIAQYNKIHLFDVDVADEKGRYAESDTFMAGDSSQTVDIEGHLLGLSICYDLRFPELYQRYQAQGCKILSVPSAFTYETGQQHWEVLLRARAIETQSFILAANQVGVHDDGRRTWGHSMIIDPTGKILAQSGIDQPDMVWADFDFNVLNQCRGAMPLLKHKRLS